jgi:hypothetical protein
MYFLTDNASWITAVALDVDGGGPQGSQPLPAKAVAVGSTKAAR